MSIAKKYWNIDNPTAPANVSIASSGLAIITTATAFFPPQEYETLAFPTVKALSASENEGVIFA